MVQRSMRPYKQRTSPPSPATKARRFGLFARLMAAAAGTACIAPAAAQTLEVPMHRVDTAGVAESIGTVTITVAGGRLVFTPALEGLQPGLHGFHVHEKPSCEPATDPEKGKVMPAQAAGPHLDPHKTGRHDGPMGDGHLGDLPALKVDNDGKATAPVVAPRLKMADLKGRTLMIHAGGDNYSDKPEKLGGGGERIACGVIGS
jgi:superoxide dismutase, Cu-Zn family